MKEGSHKGHIFSFHLHEISRISKSMEAEIRLVVDICVYYYKELAHVTMEADKSQDLQWLHTLETQDSPWYSSILKVGSFEIQEELMCQFEPFKWLTSLTHIWKGNLLYSV